MRYAISSRRTVNIWPGFVDALAALLMVIIFLLLIFSIGQFYLSDALSGKEKTLIKLDRQVVKLADLLALEKTTSADLQETVGELRAQLSSKSRKNELLQADVDMLMEMRDQLEKDMANFVTKLHENDATLRAEKEVSAKSLAQIEILNRQVKALREQLGTVSKALGLELDVETASIESLAERLNVALAEKAQELARYRSDFFGRLREVLGENPNIQIVGDRFVLQSELLFESGSADLGEKGKAQVKKLSETLNSVASSIPDDIEWIVRIDGHTDKRSINTKEYPSNWELSTARALAIVRYMVAQDVPAKRLAATGFGEFHPLDDETTEEAYTKNRRIEIKLTSR
ncbi:MAG: peptidoglycan -binding protein [Gammaproteobacteria bacterium]|nr:peptidoglycan -binding protein [Gammaproteobacteria bacterium]NNC68408.1 peptidoglycan -binding protein [Gammaproteobacteria bacterium]